MHAIVSVSYLCTERGWSGAKPHYFLCKESVGGWCSICSWLFAFGEVGLLLQTHHYNSKHTFSGTVGSRRGRADFVRYESEAAPGRGPRVRPSALSPENKVGRKSQSSWLNRKAEEENASDAVINNFDVLTCSMRSSAAYVSTSGAPAGKVYHNITYWD